MKGPKTTMRVRYGLFVTALACSGCGPQSVEQDDTSDMRVYQRDDVSSIESNPVSNENAIIEKLQTDPRLDLEGDKIDALRSELQDPVFLCSGGHGAGAGTSSEEACEYVENEKSRLLSLLKEIDDGAIIILD